MICNFCKKEIPNNKYQGYCQACYRYFYLDNGIIYDIPKDGVIAYDEKGYVICHECGKSFRKLGGHIYNHHNMTQHEYKDKHKLYHKDKLTSKDYQDKMKAYNKFYYDDVVKNNLIKNGSNTRFKIGDATKGAGKHIKERKINNENNCECNKK